VRGARSSRRLARVAGVIALAAVLVAGAPSARADAPQPAIAGPVQVARGHVRSTVLQGAAPSTASPLEREQAQARFVRAKGLFDQRSYAAALDEFRASLMIVNSPNTRLYVARCQRETGDVVGAYVELGRTALEAREASRADGRYTLTADEAAAERDALAGRLAFVTLRLANADRATTVRVGEHEIRPEAWSEPTPVMPGVVDVIATSPGHAGARRSLQLSAGQRAALTLDLGPGAPPRERASGSALRPVAYGVAALGVAGLAVFAVEGAKARSTYDDLQSACHGPCPTGAHADDIASGVRAQTIANVGLAVGVAGVVGGVTLFVLHRGGSADRPRESALIASPSGVSIRGAF